MHVLVNTKDEVLKIIFLPVNYCQILIIRHIDLLDFSEKC